MEFVGFVAFRWTLHFYYFCGFLITFFFFIFHFLIFFLIFSKQKHFTCPRLGQCRGRPTARWGCRIGTPVKGSLAPKGPPKHRKRQRFFFWLPALSFKMSSKKKGKKKKKKSKAVAVIGAGLAGLSCARRLGELGFDGILQFFFCLFFYLVGHTCAIAVVCLKRWP